MMKSQNASASSMAPLFEKIEGLTKSQRIAIYAVTMILLIGVAVWWLFWPKYQEIGTLEKQLVQRQQELAKAKKNARELNDWRNKMKKKEAQFKTVMRALPEKEEIPSLLAGISQAGKDAGLEFLLFQPKPESSKDFYAEIPVDISVIGKYHQVAVFFDKISNLPRIVNVRNIKMVPKSKENTLTTTCQAVTYKFIESAGKAQQGNKKGNQHRKK